MEERAQGSKEKKSHKEVAKYRANGHRLAEFLPLSLLPFTPPLSPYVGSHRGGSVSS